MTPKDLPFDKAKGKQRLERSVIFNVFFTYAIYVVC